MRTSRRRASERAARPVHQTGYRQGFISQGNRRPSPRERLRLGTWITRGTEAAGGPPAVPLVGPVLQAPHATPEGEVGPARGGRTGEGHRPREGRDRGEAAELRPEKVREGPAREERAPDHRARRGRGRDQLQRRARRGPRGGDRRPHGSVLRRHPGRAVQGHQGERRLPRPAREGQEGEARPVSTMAEETPPPPPPDEEDVPPPPPPPPPRRPPPPPPPPPAETAPAAEAETAPAAEAEPAPAAEAPAEAPAKAKKEPKKPKKKYTYELKLFERHDLAEVAVPDPGLTRD